MAAGLRNSSLASGQDGRVKVHTSTQPNVRMHSAVNPLAGVEGVNWKRPFKEELVEAEKLVKTLGRAAFVDDGDFGSDSVAGTPEASSSQSSHRSTSDLHPPWLYFFSPLANFSGTGVAEDIGDYDFLAYGGSRNAIMEANVWIGQPNVTTPLHYDAVHNSYAQLRGRKHFTIVPPWYWKCLYLFPGIHPSARMTQVPWDSLYNEKTRVNLAFSQLHPFLHESVAVEADQARNAGDHSWSCGSLFARGVVQEVILSPGDVLYLPPFWFHRVEAVGTEPSMSVSVHSESDALEVRGITNSRAVPGVRNVTYGDALALVQEYVKTLLDELSWKMETFATDILDSMYDPLQFDTEAEHLWESILEAETSFQEHARLVLQDANDINAPVPDLSKVREAAAVTARGISVTGSSLQASAVEILVAQYVEDILCDTFGAAFVAPVLRFLAGRLSIPSVSRANIARPRNMSVFVPGDMSTFARPGDWVRVKLTIGRSEEEVWEKQQRQDYELNVGGARRSFKALEEILAQYSLGTQLVVTVPFEYGFGSRGSAELGIAPFETFVMKVKIQMIVPL